MSASDGYVPHIMSPFIYDSKRKRNVSTCPPYFSSTYKPHFLADIQSGSFLYIDIFPIHLSISCFVRVLTWKGRVKNWPQLRNQNWPAYLKTTVLWDVRQKLDYIEIVGGGLYHEKTHHTTYTTKPTDGMMGGIILVALEMLLAVGFGFLVLVLWCVWKHLCVYRSDSLTGG